MGAANPIDRDALYRYLWTKRDVRTDRVRVHQTQLAEAMMVRIDTIHLIMKQFQEQGKMRRIGTTQVRVYELVDPDLWEKGERAGPRQIKWG